MKIIYSIIIFFSNPINLFPVYSIIYEFDFIKKCLKNAKISKKEEANTVDLDEFGINISQDMDKNDPKVKQKTTSLEDISIKNLQLEKLNLEIDKKNKIRNYFIKYLIRIVVMVIGFLIAIVSPNFVKFISLIGSFIFSMLGFVFPVSIIYLVY